MLKEIIMKSGCGFLFFINIVPCCAMSDQESSWGLHEFFRESTSPIDCEFSTKKIPPRSDCMESLFQAVLTNDVAAVERLVPRVKGEINKRLDHRENALLHLLFVRAEETDLPEDILSILKILIESRYVDLTMINDEGATPLHVAIHKNLIDSALLLIQRMRQERIRLNIWDFHRNSLVHLAVVGQSPKLVAALLSAPEVNANIVNSQDKTPLDIAEEMENQEIIALLREHGAVHASDVDPKIKHVRSHQRKASSFDGAVFAFDYDGGGRP